MDKVNEIKINVPEGMEYYIENDIIKFRPIKKELTYDDIAKELFYKKDTWYTSDIGKIYKFTSNDNYKHLNNYTSEKQAKKLLAINQLMNVAKYLNGNWNPNWFNDKEYKYYIFIYNGKIDISNTASSHCLEIYFKSKELAQQAIDILGEETIKLALCTDW